MQARDATVTERAPRTALAFATAVGRELTVRFLPTAPHAASGAVAFAFVSTDSRAMIARWTCVRIVGYTL